MLVCPQFWPRISSKNDSFGESEDDRATIRTHKFARVIL